MTASAWNPSLNMVTQANANGLLKMETQAALDQQRDFIIGSFAYVVGTGSLLVFKNKLLLVRNQDYTEVGPTEVLLFDKCVVSDQVTFVGFVGIQGSATVDAQLRADLLADSGSSIVKWLRAAAGAVSRYLNKKLEDILTTADFGVVADGIVDDYPAMQAALNALQVPGKPKKLLVLNGAAGLIKISQQLTIATTGGVTIEFESNNISLVKAFNGDAIFVSKGLVKFVNLGIDGQGQQGRTGGGVRFADASFFTFDNCIDNPRITNTADSGVIFNGPRGGSGTRVTGGSITPYNPTGVSSAGPAGIRLSGPADTDATPRIFTDIESSSSPLIDVTGMVTTFVKGGQCGTILFGGNTDVTSNTFVSAKTHCSGVRIRDGLNIRGQDHAFSACISHNFAPGQTTYGWVFKADAQNCYADSSNIVINKISDETPGNLGDNCNKFFAIDMPYTPVWSALTTQPALGNGTISGTYNVNGATVEISIMLSIGSTTTFGAGAYFFSLPFIISASPYQGIGSARVFNSGVKAGEIGICCEQSRGNPSTIAMFAASGDNFSPTVPHVFKSGDYIQINYRFLRG